MKFRKIVSIAGLVFVFAVAGCGNVTPPAPKPSATSPSTTQSRTYMIGAAPYQGQAKLKQFEQAASRSPNSENAQMQAGISAHVNGNDAMAITYYKKAIAINPNNGEAYNNIGNIYLRDYKQPQQALPFYRKATQVAPTYGYGWWNLAITYQQLKQTTAAKQAATTGLAKIAKNDPAYKGLKATLAGLK